MRRTTILIAAAIALAACGPKPKPDELARLDQIWADPAARELAEVPGAERFYRQARAFRYEAQEAWENGDPERAREYAVWSTMRYQSALALRDAIASKERLEKANAEVERLNEELLAVSKRRDEARAGRAAARRDDASVKVAPRPTKPAGEAMSPDQIARRELTRVDLAARDADALEAKTHAAALYNRAQNQRESLRRYADGTANASASQVRLTAEEARVGFSKAAARAKPAYEKARAKLDSAARDRALVDELKSALPEAEIEPSPGGGVLVVLPAAFARGQIELSASGQRAVEAIASAAARYDEYRLTVESFTSRGDPTENLALSQARARHVAKALAAAGLGAERAQSRGMGQERPRYRDDSARDERVEITMRR